MTFREWYEKEGEKFYDESRELTKEEVREQFISHISCIVDYWSEIQKSTHWKRNEITERCEGVAFSILTLLDGEAAFLPAFNVSPSPHPEDKAFHESDGTDYYPTDGKPFNDDCVLHEEFVAMRRKAL